MDSTDLDALMGRFTYYQQLRDDIELLDGDLIDELDMGRCSGAICLQCSSAPHDQLRHWGFFL